MVLVGFCHYVFYKEIMFAFNIAFFFYSKHHFTKLHFLINIYVLDFFRQNTFLVCFITNKI